MPPPRARGWCFTVNNFTSEEVEALRASEGHTYLVFGREVGEKGTPHLQGYVYYPTLKSLKQMKSLQARAHWERQRGTPEQAALYCKKDNDFEEFGVVPVQRRLDPVERNKRLRDEPLSDLVESGELSMFSVPTIKRARTILAQEATAYQHDAVRGVWYWGPPGTGKSHKARTENPDAFIKAQSKWWDGYTGQHVVILDDLDTPDYGHLMKIWADKWACTGEIKGGTVHLCHRKFIVTSNYHPSKLWEHQPVMAAAITRRFDIIHMTEQRA